MRTKNVLVRISHWTVCEVDQSCGSANIDLPIDKYAEYLMLEEKFKQAQHEIRQLMIRAKPELERTFYGC